MSNLVSLAIVAGGGAFPDLVADAASAAGTRIFAVRLTGDATPDTLKNYDGIWARPEKMGFIFETLRAEHITNLVFIGRMQRPRLLSLRPDFTTLRILPKIVPALCFQGDDGLLRAVRRAVEGEGFTLYGAHMFLDALLAQEGVMGCHAPASDADVIYGRAAAKALGARDAGQAVIVKNGIIIAEEGTAGTDALIEASGCAGAVLVKMAKPQQDKALDMPAIGPETVRQCAAKGMAGIAVEAGATLVSNKAEVIALADAHGLFLTGIK